MLMSMPEIRPNLQNAANYLGKLEQAPSIAKAMIDSTYPEAEKDIEAMIYRGYSELITMFNAYGDNRYMELTPNVKTLQDLLGGRPLPSIDELGPRDYLTGMQAAKSRMLKGQDIKYRRVHGENIAQAEVNHAIGAPSVDGHPDVLAVGTAGHILERTIFAHLKKQGVDTDTWVKDQVLWALEDLAVLSYVDSLVHPDHKPAELYHTFATPPNPEDPNSGMGWRKEERSLEILERYKQLEAA